MCKLPGIYVTIKGKRYKNQSSRKPIQNKVFTLDSSHDGNGNVILLTSGFTLNSAHDVEGNVTLTATDGCSLSATLTDGVLTLEVK